MSKIGIVLSGCGVNDGSEIHEAVITMLELDKAGAEMIVIAPNIDQLHVINHATGEEMDDSRNVLIESARISRGNIEDIAGITSKDLDALIFPGGFGVAPIGHGRHSNKGECARLSSHNGEGHCPPRKIATPKEIISGGFLPLTQPHSQCNNPNEIHCNHCPIEGMNGRACR